ncbi:hypothetical protein JOQ06_020583 [Pogonophryne albipinna]|uniref:Ig-like domain-containing protein n=1 Tax=Pogonophryne albipinna TaxID=1090488 RepID=A0AAD6BT29_9TELE|nr:hypothetical protein JOQ06_020583 [Pogonophryne albipinna]
MFKIYVLLVTLFRAYGALLYAEPGQNVTLKCFYTSIDNNLCWYKQDSDSAIYYCGKTSGVVTEFDNGTFLVLKESSLRYLLQQPESDSVKPGGSVTLNCTVHTGTNDTEQSVYWFKKENSTNSKHVGTMYIHTNGSSQCVQSLGSEFPAWSCVHSLSKQNRNGVSPPHTSGAEYTPNIENQESKDLEYEALDFKTMRSKSKRKRSTEDETVYSTVRLT